MLEILTMYNNKNEQNLEQTQEINDSINLVSRQLGDTQPRMKESTILPNIHRKFTKADHMSVQKMFFSCNKMKKKSGRNSSI